VTAIGATIPTSDRPVEISAIDNRRCGSLFV
jgi:hypothetical protein